MCVKRHKVNRRVEALEDRFEPRWLSFDHSLHGKCCSGRCSLCTSSRAWRRPVRSTADSGRYSTSRPYRAFRRSSA
jgi:hypothetical protein